DCLLGSLRGLFLAIRDDRLGAPLCTRSETWVVLQDRVKQHPITFASWGVRGTCPRSPGSSGDVRSAPGSSIEEDIAAHILSDLAKKHRDTPVAGRTHLQQALPVTFGYKAATSLAMFDRHAERLQQLKP